MGLADVQVALLTAAEAKLTELSIPFARENSAFTKPVSAKWGRLVFVPNQPSVETLGALGEDMVDGFLQVDIFYPAGTGYAAALSDFEAFRMGFVAGHSFASSGQLVTVNNCGRSQGRLDGSWYIVSIRITWWAMIPR